jgi:hypothetical protein
MFQPARAPDKQANNRSGFVAGVGLTDWSIVQYQGRIRHWEQGGGITVEREDGPPNSARP